MSTESWLLIGGITWIFLLFVIGMFFFGAYQKKEPIRVIYKNNEEDEK